MQEITATELKQRIEKGTRPFILDVRTEKEFEEGHIADSTHIPLDELLAREPELPLDKETEIVCVCRSGSRSAYAAQILQQIGFSNSVNLVGGFEEFKQLT